MPGSIEKRIADIEEGHRALDLEPVRARALTHLFRVYGEVRRMIGYVRWWHGDADEIAPPLYAARARRARTKRAPVSDPAPPA